MQEFFKTHLDFVNNDFYIFGESYAGHYVPALASRVNQGNKQNQGLHINLKVLHNFLYIWLGKVNEWNHTINYVVAFAFIDSFDTTKGFAIGNGLTNPAIQFQAYPDFALDNRIITKAQYDNVTMLIPHCEQAIKTCGTSFPFVTCIPFYHGVSRCDVVCVWFFRSSRWK